MQHFSTIALMQNGVEFDKTPKCKIDRGHVNAIRQHAKLSKGKLHRKYLKSKK